MNDDTRVFALTDRAILRAAKFIARHNARHGASDSAIGGRFIYSFTPTGVGTFVDVRCADCRKFVRAEDGESF